YGVYVFSAAFALVTAAALVVPRCDEFVQGKSWNLLYMATFLPLFVLCLVLVFLRKREVHTAVERNAANFVAFGIAVAVVMGFTELIHTSWTWVPPLGHVGSLLCTVVLAVAILRHRLLERQAPVRSVFYFLLLAASAVVVIMLLSSVFHGSARPVFLFVAAGVV